MVPPGSEVTRVRSTGGRQAKVKEIEEAKSPEVTLRASTLRRRSEAERERLQVEQVCDLLSEFRFPFFVAT